MSNYAAICRSLAPSRTSPQLSPHHHHDFTLSLVVGVNITRAPNLALDGSDIWLVIKMLGCDWLSRVMLSFHWPGLSMLSK